MGPQGASGGDRFYFSGSSGGDTIGGGPTSFVALSGYGVSTNGDDLATVMGTACDEIELTAILDNPPGVGHEWDIYLASGSLENFGSNVFTQSLVCSISGNDDKHCSGVLDTTAILNNPTHRIAAFFSRTGSPALTRTSVSIRCLDE